MSCAEDRNWGAGFRLENDVVAELFITSLLDGDIPNGISDIARGFECLDKKRLVWLYSREYPWWIWREKNKSAFEYSGTFRVGPNTCCASGLIVDRFWRTVPVFTESLWFFWDSSRAILDSVYWRWYKICDGVRHGRCGFLQESTLMVASVINDGLQSIWDSVI